MFVHGQLEVLSLELSRLHPGLTSQEDQRSGYGIVWNGVEAARRSPDRCYPHRICSAAWRREPAYGWVAQMVEQWSEKPRVAGSIPAPTTK